MPKSTTRVLSVMQTAVIIGFFIFFLWCLYRKLPQEDSEYPDGFNVQCVTSSYKILDNRNVTIKCKACPLCPIGHEPTPPCGSTIFIETTIKCTMCNSPVTFSAEHSSGACMPCQSCGLRDTISPCTKVKNMQCGHCRQGYNCAEQIKYKQIHALTFRKILRQLVPTEREENATLLKQEIIADATGKAEVTKSRLQADDSNPMTTIKSFSNYNGVRSLSATKINLDENAATAPESNVMETSMPLPSCNSDGVKKLLNILIALVVFVIVVLIFVSVIVTCMCCKRIHPADDQFDENWNEDEMKKLANAETTTEICDQNATQIEEDLNLSEIPQDLEDILVTILDVSLGRPGRKEYGWQKVGCAAGISRLELKVFHNEYLRENGSPTKLLLEKLGGQGKTIAYLLDVLQTPRVQLGSVAESIRHRVTRVGTSRHRVTHV